MFLIDANNLAALALYLKKQEWLRPNEEIKSATKPGEGNMNFVLRIHTGQRTFILKQSKAWVEKYPQIAAPATRTTTEGQFYSRTQTNRLIKDFSPSLIGVDSVSNIIALEDVVGANDFLYLYRMRQKISQAEIIALTNYLSILHSAFYKAVTDDELSNTEMKLLQHQHIFVYPFLQNNGFDLNTVQQGLQAIALPYQLDNDLKIKAARLGAFYLANGRHLLHGDFYPGSWLKTGNQIKIIDPEFCFYGRPEFDIAILIAHLTMTDHDEQTIDEVKQQYLPTVGFNFRLVQQFSSLEIMRRLIGLAQLPLQLSLAKKESLLKQAYQVLMD